MLDWINCQAVEQASDIASGAWVFRGTRVPAHALYLLAAAEEKFDVLVTTDQNLRYQQSLEGRKLAVPVLPTTSWPRLRDRVSEIAGALASLQAGSYLELPR